MQQQRIDFKILKRRASFGPVLEHYRLPEQRMRSQHFILCPFHTETKPSCRISADRRAFRCFGCGAKGSLLDFVARMERCSLVEAAELIVQFCSLSPGDLIPLPSDGAQVASTANRARESNPPLMLRLSLDPTHPYLAARGVTAELAERFGLGYCNTGVMRGRIAIPIHDRDGQLVAYAGRWASDQVPVGVPRYLLPRGFRKQRVLYNLNRLCGERQIVLVESYWSVFRLAALDVFAVGLMGRELSDAHIELLRSIEVERIGLMLDGDQPGRSAAQKMLPELTRWIAIKVIELPDGLKPHSAPEDVVRHLLGDIIVSSHLPH